MKEKIIEYLQTKFEIFGNATGATFSEIVFTTKIKGSDLNPLLIELIQENKIRVKSGEHIDLYYIIINVVHN